MDDLVKLLVLRQLLSDSSSDETVKAALLDVGLRVVRGPDWKWADQDDGAGHVGTVVKLEKPDSSSPKWVDVQWDSGVRQSYRIGHNNGYDLRTLDNASLGVKHPTVTCNSCQKKGILGMRWKCRQCYDYDMCTQCYMSDKHDITHPFFRIQTVDTSRVEVPKRQGGVKLPMIGIFSSAKVVRGPDWSWDNQDGGNGKTGLVTGVCGWDDDSDRNTANVAWSSGDTSNRYRIGKSGKVDLKYVEAAVDGYYYRDHLPILGDETRAVKVEDSGNTTVKESATRKDSGSTTKKTEDKKKDETTTTETGSLNGAETKASKTEDSKNIIKEAENEKSTETEGSENKIKEAENGKSTETKVSKAEDRKNVIKEAENEKRKQDGFILLLQNLEDLLTSGQFCDFTVKVKDRQFQIHKAIVGARSSVFASMLQHDMKEKNTGFVELSDCDPDTFDDFLFYLYSGKAERISHKNVTGLYEAAEKYDVQGLKEECIHFMQENLSVDIFCDVMTLAVTYCDKMLIERATEYFISNAQEILLTVNWQIFVKENPIPANELYIKALQQF